LSESGAFGKEKFTNHKYLSRFRLNVLSRLPNFRPAPPLVGPEAQCQAISEELEAHAWLGSRAGACPVGENWARQCLSLPIYPELAAAQLDFCVAALEAALLGREPQMNGSAG
jgi:hypothetical protein